MKHVLDNPVYHGLISGDAHLGFGTEKARFFDENVSPFAGFEEGYEKGFEDLYDLLPTGRTILYAVPYNINEPRGWQLVQKIGGLQLIFDSDRAPEPDSFRPFPLEERHIGEMMQLTALTNPGPFGPRTIDFGNYFGVFENKKLAAMAGQRLHVQEFTEVSAVCTHPSYLSRGYASALVRHQIGLILQQKQTPFLHVRDDNSRAIELYQRIGFRICRNMNFYLMKKPPAGSR